MGPQIAFIRKCIVTLVAFAWLFSDMCIQMNPKKSLPEMMHNHICCICSTFFHYLGSVDLEELLQIEFLVLHHHPSLQFEFPVLLLAQFPVLRHYPLLRFEVCFPRMILCVPLIVCEQCSSGLTNHFLKHKFLCKYGRKNSWCYFIPISVFERMDLKQSGSPCVLSPADHPRRPESHHQSHCPLSSFNGNWL